jgi:YMGG-like Gly-zipper
MFRSKQNLFLVLLIFAVASLVGTDGSLLAQQRVSGALNGTWRLNPSRSDNVEEAVDRALGGVASNPQGQPDRMRDRLTRRLDSPETIAIEQRGRRITVASTRAPQATFEADGRDRTETLNNGRSVRLNASLLGNQLTVTTTGDRGSDFEVTFEPTQGGQRMRVTRRIYADRLDQPVTVNSVYEKISDIAQLDLYSGRRDDTGVGQQGQGRGRFTIPNDTQIIAVLNTDLDSKRSQIGDRFNLTVRSPGRYSGAVIEGTVAQVERSGRVSGRAEMGLDFDRIRLRDGGSYDFEGYIESIRTPDGDEVRVNNEGSVKEDTSQTERTVTRTGIGAAVGAVIGAIAGGGKGAAIGAAVGAGAGAGSVFIEGRDDLQLRSGSELTIRASAPRNVEARR